MQKYGDIGQMIVSRKNLSLTFLPTSKNVSCKKLSVHFSYLIIFISPLYKKLIIVFVVSLAMQTARSSGYLATMERMLYILNILFM
jgi:hypothetical protein